MAKERGDIGFLAVESCSVDERRKLMKWYQYVGIGESNWDE